MHAQARKVLKDVQEKLQEEVTAQKRTLDALTKHVNTEVHTEKKILEMREEADGGLGKANDGGLG